MTDNPNEDDVRDAASASVTKDELDTGSCPSADSDGQHCVHWWDCEPCHWCGHEGGGEDSCDCEKHATQRRIRELEEEVRTWTARLWTLCCAIFEKHPGRIKDLAHRNADHLRTHFRQESFPGESDAEATARRVVRGGDGFGVA